MRQAVVRRDKLKLRHRYKFMAFLFVAVVLVFCVSLFFTGKKPAQPADEEVMTALAGVAGRYHEFALTIEESGPGYSLRYEGQVKGDLLYGTFETFNLQVYAQGKNYYVRGGEVFAEWLTVEKAEMQALVSFVRNPLDLLALLLASEEFTAEKGPDRLIDGVQCTSYLLDISPSAALLPDLFSAFQEEEADLEELHIYMWFGAEDNFLYKMAFTLNIYSPADKVTLSRVYTMHRAQADLPDDLPPPNRAIEI